MFIPPDSQTTLDKFYVASTGIPVTMDQEFPDPFQVGLGENWPKRLELRCR